MQLFSTLAAPVAIVCSLAGTAAAAPIEMTLEQAEAHVAALLDQTPDLTVGDDAPDLHVARWVQGDAVESFEAGTTYVVEMWAEWCGPCIRAIPHVNELYERYNAEGKKLTVIGMNIWDEQEGEATNLDARQTRIENFIAKRAEDMTYTVAFETGSAMADAWMTPAGRTGIPAAFIVNGEGKIAWVGHPMSMDAPLDQIVSGHHDLAAARTKALEEHKAGIDPVRNLLVPALDQLADSSTEAEAYKTIEAIAQTEIAGNSRILGAVAIQILTNQEIDNPNMDWLTTMADRAVEADDTNTIAHTAHALIHARSGRNAEAIDILQRVMDLAGDDVQTLMQLATSIPDVTGLDASVVEVTAAMAEKACELTEWENPAPVVVYGRNVAMLGNAEKAQDILATKLMPLIEDDAQSLNGFAWRLVNNEQVAAHVAPAAIAMAEKACELTSWAESDIIDTLARAQWENGDRETAIETQAKAVEAADEDAKAELQKTLNEYKTKLAS